MSYPTPILFLVFNRPETTRLVFEEIKKQRPRNLFIAADGPRQDKPDDNNKCHLTKQLILDGVDWECEIKTLFRDNNLGCGEAVAGAITWFFEHVEEGVILEDDCVPHQSFFNFCTVLLKEYRFSSEIMHIGGSNFQNKDAGSYSYYFSNYIHIWGWATWRRAWQHYSFTIPALNDRDLNNILEHKFSKCEQRFWRELFQQMSINPLDTWDTQWVFSLYRQRGIGISAARNLVSNVGFGPEATHTHNFDSKNAERPTFAIREILHPPIKKVNRAADRFTFKLLYQSKNIRINRIKFSIGQKLPWIKKLYICFKREFPKSL